MKDYINKDIQLCGIGNALVDIQVEISDHELSESGYEKGTMTLVDKDTQSNSLDEFSSDKKHLSSGGSAANTIIAYSSFGGKAAYKTALGIDELGGFYSEEFKELGIVLSEELDSQRPTGSCLLFITPDAERTQATYLGANDAYGSDSVDEDLIKRSEWLYIEGYKLTSDEGFEAVKKSIELAKSNCTKLALTLSDKFIVDVFRERIDEIYGKMDLIFCNDLEARTYTETNDNHQAYSSLVSKGTNFAMTMGKEGSKIYFDGDNIEIDPYPVTATDSTGAGDMYAAGFFYGLTHGRKPYLAGKLGSLAASKIVSQFGARLNSSHTELRDKVFRESKIFS